jgi:hypothetical protein
VFQLVAHWDGTGWCENSTRRKPCTPARARGRGAWACLAHGLQCLCDGRACCPPLFMQRFALEVSPAPSPWWFTSLFHWDGTGWFECFAGVKTVQMGTWLWCMGMFGACIAVFLRERRVLPSPLYATRNLSLLRYPRPRHLGGSPRCSLGWYGLV